MREIELTVAQLDNVSVNHKISIQSNNSLRAKQEDFETSGSVKLGSVGVTNNHQFSANSIRVEQNKTTSNISQFLTNILTHLTANAHL